MITLDICSNASLFSCRHKCMTVYMLIAAHEAELVFAVSNRLLCVTLYWRDFLRIKQILDRSQTAQQSFDDVAKFVYRTTDIKRTKLSVWKKKRPRTCFSFWLIFSFHSSVNTRDDFQQAFLNTSEVKNDLLYTLSHVTQLYREESFSPMCESRGQDRNVDKKQWQQRTSAYLHVDRM